MITTDTRARVSLYGVTYEIDLGVCRERLLVRAAELGAGQNGGGLELISKAAGVSRSTLRLFLEGQKVSVESFVSIITRGLALDVSSVAKKVAA